MKALRPYNIRPLAKVEFFYAKLILSGVILAFMQEVYSVLHRVENPYKLTFIAFPYSLLPLPGSRPNTSPPRLVLTLSDICFLTDILNLPSC
jgi:hypothetical protein